MSHYRYSIPTSPVWWLQHPCQHHHGEFLKNVANNRERQIRVKLHVADYNRANHSIESTAPPLEDKGAIPFLLDTGAEITLFKGKLADSLIGQAGETKRQRYYSVAEKPVDLEVGRLSVRICNRWVSISCAFLTTELAAGITEFRSPAILGMKDVLLRHHIAMSHEGIDIFARPGQHHDASEFWRLSASST